MFEIAAFLLLLAGFCATCVLVALGAALRLGAAVFLAPFRLALTGLTSGPMGVIAILLRLFLFASIVALPLGVAGFLLWRFGRFGRVGARA